MSSPGYIGKTLKVGSVLFNFIPSPTLNTIVPHALCTFHKDGVNSVEIRSFFCSALKSFHSHFSETKQVKDLLIYVERIKKL